MSVGRAFDQLPGDSLNFLKPLVSDVSLQCSGHNMDYDDQLSSIEQKQRKRSALLSEWTASAVKSTQTSPILPIYPEDGM